MRRDLRELHVLDADSPQLQLLNSYRDDLAADRTRSINRLRGRLTGVFPALDRVLDFTNRGPLILISGFQTPTAIRQLGAGRLTGWLKRRGVRGAGRLAHAAVEAASRQPAQVPGQAAVAYLIVRLAQTVLDLDRQLTDLDHEVAGIFQTHDDAAIITS